MTMVNIRVAYSPGLDEVDLGDQKLAEAWFGLGELAYKDREFLAAARYFELALSNHYPEALARANLARWTGEVGNVDRAKDLAAAVLGDFVRLYGPDHRYTVVVRSWLAPWAPQSVEH